MPQCQFPVFCCFCVPEKLHKKYSRNWTKRSQKFLFSPDTRWSPKKSRRGARKWCPPGRATLWCGNPWYPLTSPLRLHKASGTKTLNQLVFLPEKFCSAAAIEDQFRGIEVSVPAPCRDGELPPEPSLLTPPPSPSTLLSPMMRREQFSPGAGGSTGSYVVHLSLP
jgi:hypothetical protein